MSTPPAGDQPLQLTVAILARGEQESLIETMRSAEPLADEMLIVCFEAPGAARFAARDITARWIDVPWRDDYSAARNAGLANARGQWVLWLEAGEVVDPDKADDLVTFVDTMADRRQVYQLFVEAPWTTDSPVREQISQIRLVPRRPGLVYRGRVNECLRGALDQLAMSTQPLDCQIRQIDRRQPESESKEGWRTQLRLAKIEMSEGDRSNRVCLAAGTALSFLRQHDEAEQYFRQVIEKGKPKSSEVLEAYYGLLTVLEQDSEDAGRQIETCLKALDTYPLDAQLLSGLGTYMLRQGRLDLAARSFRVALEHGRVDPETWHAADINEVAACCLSLTLQRQGDLREAQQVLENVLSQYPAAHRVRRQLLDLLVRQKDLDAALATFDLLPDDLPCREALHTAIRGGVLAAQGKWTAAEPYLASAYTAGCRDALCLRWMAITYLAQSRLEDARPVLREWQASEPYNLEPKTLLEAMRNEGLSAVASVLDSDYPIDEGQPATASERQIRIDASPHHQPADFRPSLPSQTTHFSRNPGDPPPASV